MTKLASYALDGINKQILADRSCIAPERGATKWVRSYRFDHGASLTNLDMQARSVGYEVTRQRSVVRGPKVTQKTDMLDGMTRRFPYDPDEGPFASLFLLDMHVDSTTTSRELMLAEAQTMLAVAQEGKRIQRNFPAIPPKDPMKKLERHHAKSAQRYADHLQGLSKHSWTTQTGKPFPQHVTEIRGEYVAAKILTTLFGKEDGQSDYQLKLGFQPGVGVDQIWAVRGRDAQVKKYVIVEAKGSRSAELGWPTVGQQMSQAWVISALMHMSALPDRIAQTARKILDAIFAEDNEGIPVVGLVIQAAFSGDNKGETNNLVKVDRYHDYNLDEENAKAVRETYPAAFR